LAAASLMVETVAFVFVKFEGRVEGPWGPGLVASVSIVINSLLVA